jgi:hypothetical protein
VLARAQQRQRPALAAGQHARSEPGEQPGAQRRRLATARRPHDPQQRRARQPRHHLGHEPLAPEEDARVLDVEQGQALERTGDDAALVLPQPGALADRLQLDHVAGEVVLGRAQTRTLARRTSRCGTQAPRRLAARPLARGAVYALRDAAALLDQPRDRHLGVLARIQSRHGGHSIGVERGKGKRRVDAQLGRKHGILGRRHDEHRQRGQPVDQPAKRGAQLVAAAVEVVEDQQRGPPRRSHAAERGRGSGGRGGARGVEHRAAVALHLAREFGRQPRLADPTHARDQHELTGTAVSAPPALAQPVEIGLAARQRRPGVELGRQPDPLLHHGLERRVLAQDRLVHAT